MALDLRKIIADDALSSEARSAPIHDEAYAKRINFSSTPQGGFHYGP